MAISGDLKLFRSFSPHPLHPPRPALSLSKRSDCSPSSSSKRRAVDRDTSDRWNNSGCGSGSMMVTICPGCFQYLLISLVDPRCPKCDAHVPFPKKLKIPFGGLPYRGGSHDVPFKRPLTEVQCFWNRVDKHSATNMNDAAEGFLLYSINKSFSERLSLAWRILFPSTTTKKNTNARIAKQRLKMILYSDRCEVSDAAKAKIVSSIVEALSDFVEIESEDKVQLSVSTDPGLGTIYSVGVPVRRVKPEYQESEEDYRGKITGVEYRDTGEESGSVDVRFNFFVPDDK